MKFDAKVKTMVGGLEGAFIGLSAKDNSMLPDLEKLQDYDLTVEIKKKSKKRSLDSNAYMWVLLQKMAEVLRSDKDSIYLDMLEKYGQFTPMVIRPEAVERMQKEWRTSRIIGEVNVNGQKGIQLLCFYGSHTYDQREMSVLINGIVEECHELEIETMTPQEIAAMNERWCPVR